MTQKHTYKILEPVLKAFPPFLGPKTLKLAKQANTRLYFIRRLKKLGASILTLTEAFKLFVRPILEMCAPLWTGALFLRTGKSLSESLECVQKAFCKILLPDKDYASAIQIFDFQINVRQVPKIDQNFWGKNVKEPKIFISVPQNGK